MDGFPTDQPRWVALAPILARFVAGAVHVLAGPDHLAAVTPLATAFSYLAAYSVASIGVMGLFAGAAGRLSERLGPRSWRAYQGLLSTVAVGAISVGAFWIVR